MKPSYPLRRDAILLASYFFLALVLTYPLFQNILTQQPSHGVDDPALTWCLWWVRYALFDLGVNPLVSDYVFYPVGINLVAYTPTFFNALLSIPIQFTLGVIAAQNLLIYFSLVASGYGAFLFTRQVLTRLRVPRGNARDFAAALGGAFFAFGAWHVNYVWGGNFFLLSNQWMPFYALFLLKVVSKGVAAQPRWASGAGSAAALPPFADKRSRSDAARRKFGAPAGIFFALTAWTELTFALLLVIFSAAYLAIVIASRETAKQSHPLHMGIASSQKKLLAMTQRISAFIRIFPRPLIQNLALAALIALVATTPLWLNLLSDTLRYGYYLAEGVGRVQIFSAEPISFLIPSARHPLLGAWAGALTDANTHYAFIGYAALVLAAVGFFSFRKYFEARVWALLAAFFAILMLGATLIIGAQSTGIPLPFALLRAIPFVNANRYPARFNVLLMLALAPLLAMGAARLMRARRGVLAALVALLAFEQLVIPIPIADLRVPAFYQTIRDAPGDFAILELPLGWRGSVALQGKQDDRAQFFQTVHHKRLLGGITSRVPQFKLQYFLEAPVINSLIALETGNSIDKARREQDRALAPAMLRFFDIRYVVVNRALADGELEPYARNVFPLTEIAREGDRVLYRVTPQSLPTRLDPGDDAARLNFDERWGRAQFSPEGAGYRYAAANDAGIWLALAPGDAQITLRLRGTHAAQKISARVNGQLSAEWNVTDEWGAYELSVSNARDGLNEIIFSTETVPLNATRQPFDYAQDDYTIGDTGVASPVDIAVTGAGFDAGKFGEIFVAGRNVIPNTRGYHLAAINPASGAVERVASFDTFADAAESARLAQFIAELPRGEIVAGAGIDEVSRLLQPAAVEALRTVGVETDLRFQIRAGHAFIGVKGAEPGQAVERADGRLPANVAVGKNVTRDRVAFALGEINIIH